MTTTVIPVIGMTCGGCVNSVTKALTKVDGVENVNVTLENNQATITYNEALTNVTELKAAIEDAGFDTH